MSLSEVKKEYKNGHTLQKVAQAIEANNWSYPVTKPHNNVKTNYLCAMV